MPMRSVQEEEMMAFLFWLVVFSLLAEVVERWK